MFLSFHLQGEAVYLFRLQKYIKKMNSVTNGGRKKVKTFIFSSVTLNPYRLSAMPKYTPSCLTGNTKKTGRRNPYRLQTELWAYRELRQRYVLQPYSIISYFSDIIKCGIFIR